MSDWLEVTQERSTRSPTRPATTSGSTSTPSARAETPFGGTIAHGYYTLSLASRFLEELLHVDGVAMMVNYGLNKVRFPSPLPVGDRVRMRLASPRSTTWRAAPS